MRFEQVETGPELPIVLDQSDISIASTAAHVNAAATVDEFGSRVDTKTGTYLHSSDDETRYALNGLARVEQAGETNMHRDIKARVGKDQTLEFVLDPVTSKDVLRGVMKLAAMDGPFRVWRRFRQGVTASQAKEAKTALQQLSQSVRAIRAIRK